MTTTHKTLIGIIVAVLVIGGAVYMIKGKSDTDIGLLGENQNQTATTSNGSTTGTSTIPGTNIVVQGANGASYTIEPVPFSEGQGVPQPIPNLDRPVAPAGSATVTAEAKAAAAVKITSLQSRLKKNPADVLAWIDLGMYQKQAGDYQGSVISWQYAGKLSPADYVSRANLGNLYAYFLKDNGQAEMYYKQAIAKGSTQAYLYTQLAEVYRDVFGDKEKALAIVNQGLSQIPNDANLLQLKASLQ